MAVSSSDEALMQRYAAGHKAAFDTLYGRYRSVLMRYLKRQCATAGAAEEVYQETWLSLVRNRRSYRPTAAFKTYLFRIAHHKLVDHYRRKDPARLRSLEGDAGEASAEPIDPGPSPDRYVESQKQIARLMSLIGELPEAQRQAFLLREEAGLGLEAIAEVTGVAPETAKSRLRYAVRKLRQGLMEAAG